MNNHCIADLMHDRMEMVKFSSFWKGF